MAGGNTHRKKSCACCKEYLEHLGGKMRCFLRRMAADSMHSMVSSSQVGVFFTPKCLI